MLLLVFGSAQCLWCSYSVVVGVRHLQRAPVSPLSQCGLEPMGQHAVLCKRGGNVVTSTQPTMGCICGVQSSGSKLKWVQIWHLWWVSILHSWCRWIVDNLLPLTVLSLSQASTTSGTTVRPRCHIRCCNARVIFILIVLGVCYIAALFLCVH